MKKSHSERTKIRLRTILTVIIITSLLLSLVPTCFDASEVNAGGSLTYSSLNYYNFYSYTINEYNNKTCEVIGKKTTYNKGYTLVPDQDGQYPVLFLFHGAGGNASYKSYIKDLMNKWVDLGYIEPMIVILPEVDQYADKGAGVEDDRFFIANNHLGYLLDKVNNGGWDFSNKIDTNKGISVAGYSMGGSMSLYAAHKYPNDIINIGACSPSIHAYLGDGKWGWMNHETDVTFTQNTNAHFFFSYGQAEKNDFGANADRYNTAFENTKALNGNPNSFVYYSGYNEGHTWNTFKRGIFAFLYYVNHDTIPSDDIIEAACSTNTYSGGNNQQSTEQQTTEQSTQQQTTEQQSTQQSNPEQPQAQQVTTEQTTTEHNIEQPTSQQVTTEQTNTENQKTEQQEETTEQKEKNQNESNGSESNGSNNGSSSSNSSNSKSSNSNDSNGSSSSGSSTSSYKNEWYNGKWYNADGTQTYGYTMTWKSNGTGWWIEDSSGWYPTGTWQKINGKWYYFHLSGYMASGEWIDGYWINSDGSWTYEPLGSWGYGSGGWWYGDTSGWYATGWQKIDGLWYNFGSAGWMETNQYVDGYYLGADGALRWRKYRRRRLLQSLLFVKIEGQIKESEGLRDE